jgi:pimeloyl-ACP methyl ester carboxylesterase
VAGYSLGALIAMELGQKFPTQYDGVLAMCGMVGGTPRELQYVGDVRALFDAYYPRVLPGNAILAQSIPPTIEEVQAAVIAAITPTPANPQAPLGLYAIASTAQTPLAFAPLGNVGDPSSQAFRSLVGSLVTALYYQLLGTPDVLDRTHGHSPYDNRNTVYTMGTPVAPVPQLVPVIAAMIAASNQTVARYDITPDASNYLDRNYVPSGNLQIPVVSVHNLWDPLVPYPIHEPPFAQAVTDAGSSAMLTRQAVPAYGHCSFPTAIVLDSFRTLVTRVNPTS